MLCSRLAIFAPLPGLPISAAPAVSQSSSRSKKASASAKNKNKSSSSAAEALERRRPAEPSPHKKTPSTVTSASLRPRAVLHEPDYFDAGESLRYDRDQKRLLFGELVETVCIPRVGRQQSRAMSGIWQMLKNDRTESCSK